MFSRTHLVAHLYSHLVYSVSQPPCGFLTFFPKRMGIFNKFLHTLPLCARLQIFIQLSPTLTKLCHTKRDHPTNSYISLEVYLLSLFTEQMTSLLTSCHTRHVRWHYKSVYFIVTCLRQRSTKLSTTYANVWTRAFWPMVDISRIRPMWTRESRLIWHNFVKVGDNLIKNCNLAYIRACNRCVKNRLKILNRLWKKLKQESPADAGIPARRKNDEKNSSISKL